MELQLLHFKLLKQSPHCVLFLCYPPQDAMWGYRKYYYALEVSPPSHCLPFRCLRIVYSSLVQLHVSYLILPHFSYCWCFRSLEMAMMSIQTLQNDSPKLSITESHLAIKHMRELLDTFRVSLKLMKSMGDSRKVK